VENRGLEYKKGRKGIMDKFNQAQKFKVVIVIIYFLGTESIYQLRIKIKSHRAYLMKIQVCKASSKWKTILMIASSFN
jgi:hypothetical protein